MTRYCPDCDLVALTRYAKRCKSCTAKVRFRTNPEPVLAALARGRQTQAETREYGRMLHLTVPVNTTAITRCIHANDLSMREVERRCGFSRGYMGYALRRGRMRFCNADTLACTLGHHVSEFAYE